ncbi:MAG: acyl-CoA dehydrogenase family protein [Polyangiaceae bacterium]
MDFTLPKDLAPKLTAMREVVDGDLIPLEPELLASKSFRSLEPKLEVVRAKVKKLGLWAPQVPKEAGGMGLTLMEHARVSEELGRSPLGHYAFNCQAPDAGNMEILLQFGTEPQKEKFLKPLLAGDVRSCFAMTEPDRAGSNPTWLDTRARKEGDDYVIDGTKWFTSGADGAAFAIVMAVTTPDASPHLRASQILVPADTPGYRIVRNISVMGEAGDSYGSHSEVAFENCRVPRSNLLGEEGAGFLIAQERLGPGRIHHCMRWMGISERAFDLMCTRAAKRELSPGKPLGTKQMVQDFIAESRAEIDAARLMVMHAAWTMEHQGAHAAREEISLIKFFAARVLQHVVDRAIQVHGALGMTDDTILAYFFRHERAARIYDGADEVHKSLVAKRILKRYGLAVE